MNTLKEIAIAVARKQTVLVDNILEESPVLASIPYEEATHPMWNVYQDVESVTGGSFVDANAVLPTMSSTSQLKQTTLGIIGGQHEVSKDNANMLGGAEAYFRSKEGLFLKKTGMASELKIFNNFETFSINNSTYQKTGASSGNGYSMVAVRYASGETIGLYSPVGERTDGQLMTVTPLANGGLYKLADGTNGYGVEYRGYFGVQIASTRSVAGIFNIQSGKLPTEEQIDQMLIEVRANGANTFIYCHPVVLMLIKKYKTDKLQMSMSETDLGRGIITWDGIRFVTSYNLEASAFKTLS
jgi:hypothetical protein